MNKSELVDEVSASTELPKADVHKCIDAITETITKAISKGNSVGLVGFGTFSSKKRAARNGRNPATGESIKIKAKTVAKWKPAKDLI